MNKKFIKTKIMPALVVFFVFNLIVVITVILVTGFKPFKVVAWIFYPHIDNTVRVNVIEQKAEKEEWLYFRDRGDFDRLQGRGLMMGTNPWDTGWLSPRDHLGYIPRKYYQGERYFYLVDQDKPIEVEKDGRFYDVKTTGIYTVYINEYDSAQIISDHRDSDEYCFRINRMRKGIKRNRLGSYMEEMVKFHLANHFGITEILAGEVEDPNLTDVQRKHINIISKEFLDNYFGSERYKYHFIIRRVIPRLNVYDQLYYGYFEIWFEIDESGKIYMKEEKVAGYFKD